MTLGQQVAEAWLCYNRDGSPDLHRPAMAERYAQGAVAFCSNCGRTVVKVRAGNKPDPLWVRKMKVVEWP